MWFFGALLGLVFGGLVPGDSGLFVGALAGGFAAHFLKTRLVPTPQDELESRVAVLEEDVRRLRQLLDTLPARERQILLLRYGLAGQPPLTQLETAGLLGISRSYVSRLETHALELLRQAWGKNG